MCPLPLTIMSASPGFSFIPIARSRLSRLIQTRRFRRCWTPKRFWTDAMFCAPELMMPPAVPLIAPQDGAIIRGVATLSASASDNAGLEKVDFYRDNNVLLGTDSSSPYNISLDSTKITNGGHTIFAKATDKAGSAVLSSSRTINADNSPDAAIPSVSITSPLNGELVAGYTTITSSATDDRKISKVEFYVNGRLKCSDSLVDYTCKWLEPAKTGGTYQPQAKPYDASGNSEMSATVNVVANNVSPEISVSSPVGGATVASKAVNVSALASDNISVKQLTFYL